MKYVQTEEHKRNISEALKGKKKNNGYRFTEEQKENVRYGIVNRDQSLRNNPCFNGATHVKLNEKKVWLIRYSELYHLMSCKKLGKLLNVHPSTIDAVRRGITWKFVKEDYFKTEI